MKISEFKNKIFAQVSNADIPAALELLSREVQNTSEHYKLVITLCGKTAELKKDDIGGGFSAEQKGRMKDSIRAELLSLLEILKDEDLKGWEGQIIATEQTTGNSNVSVFLSVSTPFNDTQKAFLEYFKSKFEAHGLQLETPLWSAENPLLPVRQKMKEVSGCIVLALERMRSIENIYKPGSPKESKIREEFFTTPWIQMEAAMAYQEELPIIIFSESKLKSEGMIEMGVHEFRVFEVDSANPGQLDDDYYNNLIRYWSDKVKRHFAQKSSVS